MGHYLLLLLSFFLLSAVIAEENKTAELTLKKYEVEFAPSRNDLGFGQAVFTAMCLRKTTEAELNETQSTFTDCDTFRVNGVDQPGWYHPVGIKEVNHFVLSAQNIELGQSRPGGNLQDYSLQ